MSMAARAPADVAILAAVGCGAWLLARVVRHLLSPRDPTTDRYLQEARALDATDDLAGFRAEFSIPQASPLYFCGHSLGLMPRRAAALVREELEHWATLGERGHFEGPRWLSYHTKVRESLAALVGAKPLEVVAMNSLTVNLHLLMASFYRPKGSRTRIVIEAHAFPSDRYAVHSWAEHYGLDPAATVVELAPREGADALDTDDVVAWLDREGSTVAVVLLSGVQYYTGQRFDVPAITTAAARAGAVMGLDLAHAVGNAPLELHAWGVDFAAWCSYKYLNSGPGAIAGAFVHEKHCGPESLAAGRAPPRLKGWWGNDEASRFRMEHGFQAALGADGWQLSNPPILQLAALRGSLEVFDRAGMARLRDKSLRATGFALRMLDALAEDLAPRAGGRAPFRVITPRLAADRGTQISLRFERMPASKVPGGEAGGGDVDVAERVQGMLGAGVGPHPPAETDYRRPDVLRVAPCPLYVRFTDVHALVCALRLCLEELYP